MIRPFWIAIALAAWLGGATAMECDSAGDPVQVKSIHTQRQAFNQAIAERDISGVRAVLHDDVVLITGTDSDVYSGLDAQVDLWTSSFADPAAAIYERTPSCIRVSPRFPIALEFGQWHGEDPEGGFASGHYSAKWRLTESRWLLESETFATEDCGGRFCP
jgi:ketosteroid isomerase-like protein